VVDQFPKHAHFILAKSTMSTMDVAKLFLHEIFRLHGLLKDIICDWDRKFISQFWGTLIKMLSTKLKMSNADHLEIERTNHTLKNMLRNFVGHIQVTWEQYLFLMKFNYNVS